LQSSLLAQPFAVFGGGKTLTGVVIPAVSAQFSRDSTTVRSLEHLTLRAGQNTPAILKIGTRYPIVTSSYSSVYTTSGLPQNAAYGLANYPSYTYEDLGVNLKATPVVHRSGDVQLDLEIQVRALGAQAFPGIPVISNREYKGVITAKDGAQVIVAGQLTHSEQLGMQGIPLLHLLPGAGYAFKQEQKMTSDSEILVVITPHVLTGLNPPEAVPITVPDFIPR
jgi:type II secretory pathway component GspD/PulD (secretin)